MATLTVDCADRKQRIVGFGVNAAANHEAPTDAEADELVLGYGLTLSDLSPSPGPGLDADGLPTLEWQIAQADEDPGSAVHHADPLGAAAKLAARGMRFTVHCWYPGDGSWVHRYESGGPAPGAAGSWLNADRTLKPARYADYARWVIKQVQAVLDRGYTVAAIGPFAEPETDHTGWPVLISPAGLVAFLKQEDAGGALRAAFPGIPIIAPSGIGWASLSGRYAAPLLADAAALANLDGFATHDYPNSPWGGTPSDVGAFAAGKSVWETETWHYGAFDASITDGLWLAKKINDNVVNGYAAAFIFWNAWRFQAFPDSYVGTSWANSGLWGSYAAGKPRTKRGYVMGLYGTTAREGMFCVAHTAAGLNANTVAAFADDSRAGLLLTNDTAATLTVDVTLHNAPPVASFTRREVRGTGIGALGTAGNLESLADVAVSGGAFSITLPAYSVTALTAEATSATAMFSLPAADLGLTAPAPGVLPLLAAQNAIQLDGNTLSIRYFDGSQWATAYMKLHPFA